MQRQIAALLLSDNPLLEARVRQLTAGTGVLLVARPARDIAAHTALRWDAVLLDPVSADTSSGRSLLSDGALPVIVVERTAQDDRHLAWIQGGAQDVLPLDELSPGTFHRALIHAIGRCERESLRRTPPGSRDAETAAVTELRTAFEQGQLSLAYQPQVDIATRAITGFEALLRWQHPTLGVLYPDMFIPTAEESGLIVPIGRWIIDEACKVLAGWVNIAPELRMSVNVSPRQLECTSGDTVSATVAAACHRHGFEPARFEVELTESSGILDSPAALAEMHALAQTGVGLAVDDFGHGYTSIAYLKQLQLTRLKIDRGFVTSLPWDTRDFLIVESLMHLAGAFGLDVVAEGVETLEQEATLRGLGCRTLQGFLYSRPLAPDEALELIAGGQRLAA